MLARTEDDLVALLTTDPRFRDHPLRTRGTGFVEVGLADGAVVFAWPHLWRDRQALQPHLVRARSGYLPLILFGSDEELAEAGAEELRAQGDLAAQPLPIGAVRLAILLRNYADLLRLRREAARGELLAERYRYELDELNVIGRALSSERDIDKLLTLILEKMMDVTAADAGSVYVVEGEDGAEVSGKRLHFKVSRNSSVKLDFTETTLPVSPTSIVGRCVLSREVVNISDIYRLDAPGTGNNPWGFQHNRDFDEKLGYRTRSILTVPMIDAKEQVIGVIQLINKKRRPELLLRAPADFDEQVVAFDAPSQDLAATLASQAGISLENALLYDDIQHLFEGFVRASVLAIESRDPTTSGHSQRVAELTVGLARATHRVEHGPYRDYEVGDDELKQIEYAGLLHDFGKVGVREHVLVKPKKLYDGERDLILARFDYIRTLLRAEYSERKVRHALEASRDDLLAKVGLIDGELAARLAQIDDFVAWILKANEPTVLDQGGFERLAEIAAHTYRDPRGLERPYLTEHELRTLQISRGSLTPDEREQIESHVSHTTNFLRRIPWGRTFRNIPEIAGAHHEKLDGTGYPQRLHAEQIPVPAKMMTIADIFDALTASDRPYKAAVPFPKALDIIAMDVKGGKVDPELFRIFVEARVFEIVRR